MLVGDWLFATWCWCCSQTTVKCAKHGVAEALACSTADVPKVLRTAVVGYLVRRNAGLAIRFAILGTCLRLKGMAQEYSH